MGYGRRKAGLKIAQIDSRRARTARRTRDHHRLRGTHVRRGRHHGTRRVADGGRAALRRVARTAVSLHGAGAGPFILNPFRASVCAARTLNAAGPSRATLSLQKEHLRAACGPQQEGKGAEFGPKMMRLCRPPGRAWGTVRVSHPGPKPRSQLVCYARLHE